MKSSSITIALAGNPNSGKTAVFNALTGSRQRVGNWPGVTVEKKSGSYVFNQNTVQVIDLPGIYTLASMEAGALDERIACQYLLQENPDLIVNVIDASNLERNLYLTMQLLEIGIPVIVAVNMMDVIEKRQITIDLKKLSERLNCAVVGLVARQAKGIDALKKAIVAAREKPRASTSLVLLPEPIEKAVNHLSALLTQYSEIKARWLAIQLLENNALINAAVTPNILAASKKENADIEANHQEAADVLIADARYQMANNIAHDTLQTPSVEKPTVTQRIDRFVLNRYLGIPIFLGVMYLMFLFAINVGGAFQDFFDISSRTIFVDGTAHLLSAWHFPIWLIAILANGIGKGINTTLTFIPIIGGLFLFLSFLEDSGYMARAAFVMDRAMAAFGLPGKSFVPMIIGFGCNVPAVMGARTLENRRDRILTVMMMPFMSCGARLAIFAVFASAFFPHGGAAIIFLLYVTGILIAILTGLILRHTVLPGKPSPLVMELPPYHAPRLNILMRQLWHRLKNFVNRAGRTIVFVSIIIGVLNSVTLSGKLSENGSSESLLSVAGRAITPIFAPIGITENNWPATVGLATGILAKEVVIGTLNTLYSQQGHFIEEESNQFNFSQGLKVAALSIPQNFSALGEAIKNPIAANESPHDMNKTAYGMMYHEFQGKIGAFAYLLFVLLYFPCVSTMAVMRREIGNRWAVFSVAWSTGLAYGLSVMCYQALTFATHPWSAALWLSVMTLLFIVTIISLRRYTSREEVLDVVRT